MPPELEKFYFLIQGPISLPFNNISNEIGRTFQLKSQDFCNLFVRPSRLIKGMDYLNTIGSLVIFREVFFVSEGHGKPETYRANLCD